MPEASSASRISTHYHKIAHILLVTYSIYTAKEAALDQYLLELELQIRHKYPKILLTYYNKCLYQFRFDHLSEESGPGNVDPSADLPSTVQLDVLYPLLALKHGKSIPVDQLANPSRVLKNANKKDKDDGADDHLAFASLSFLKAVKKMLVYNLSALGHMLLFGNYVIGRVEDTSSQYAVVQIDPILLSNGDLVVSLSQRNRLALFDSSMLNLDLVFPDFALYFVIYVTPSGLRCHLYDTTNMQQSFTYTPPKSSENLLRLLKLSTGVDLSLKPQILWVKLIPNLQHLNNQTSKVSQFVHDVDNKKYILWPWELCILQFGSVELPIPQSAPTDGADPLSLISGFMDFSIACHDNEARLKHPGSMEADAPSAANAPTHLQPFSVPSALSTGASTGGHENKNSEPNLDIQEIAPIVLEIFDLQQSTSYQMFNGASVMGEQFHTGVDIVPKQEVAPEKEQKDEAEDDNDDDLFGASSDSETNSVPVDTAVNNGDVDEDMSGLFEEDLNDIKANDLDKDEDSNEESLQQENLEQASTTPMKHEDPPTFENPTFISIPRDQMISNRPKTQTPMSYNDPGAPLPVMPTPIIPQSTNSLTTHHSTPRFSYPNEKSGFSYPKKDTEQGEHLSGYVFSPIHFNPMIKSNIDTKYDKGGKFYVARESSGVSEKESKQKRLRETSVTHDVPFSILEHLGDSERKDLVLFPTSNGEEEEKKIFEIPESSVIGSQAVPDNGAEHDDDEEVEFEEEDYDDDEESDADEELNTELKTSPLKLNTNGGSDPFQNGNGPVTQMEPHRQTVFGYNTTFYGNPNSAFLSPGAGQPKTVGPQKGESPFSFGLQAVDPNLPSFSPIPDSKQGLSTDPVNEADGIGGGENKEVTSAEAVNTPGSTGSSSNGISESSNCLPLILRSINVFTIPNIFMLNNIPGTWRPVAIAPGFNMDVDEEEDDFETSKNGELSVKLKDLDEFLVWLTPNLVYDLGLQDFESQVQLKLPDLFSEEVSNFGTDGEVSPDVAALFTSAFPLSYKISLNEFICDFTEDTRNVTETSTELSNQLSFLDDITNDDILNPESSLKKLSTLNSLNWDSIYPESTGNQHNFKSYKEIMESITQAYAEKPVDNEAVFALNDVKTKVLKHGNDIINLNYLGVKFWKYFNFSPVNGPKKFQVLLISENDVNIDNGNLFDSSNLDFLDTLKNNYKESEFGSIKKLHLQTSETRPDLEGINNGLMLVDKDLNDPSYGSFYKRVNKKLKSLAELIKLDLINKSNRFEFDRPLLLLFINFDESVNSVMQISKICRNFKLFLKNHQLSLVDVFAHIIPWNYIVKQSGTRRNLRYLSNLKLSKLSMNLYNKCPNNESYEGRVSRSLREESKKLFTQLVKEPPTTLHFKFLNKINKEGYSSTFHDDIFLHVAYERTVDKNWLSAAWSDPLGIVTYTKSWYCSAAAKTSFGKDAHELGTIINDIWETSNLLFKTLNEDAIQRTCGSGSKKFLVLTRINSIIPDDELIFWKRLSAKYKDVSLIVLSANRVPKLLFSSEVNFDEIKMASTKNSAFEGQEDQASAASNQQRAGRASISSGMTGSDFLKTLNGFPGSANSSPTGAALDMTSPMHGGLNFHSPQQFMTTPGNFLSPLDGGTSNTGPGFSNGSNEADVILQDSSLDILGVIPKTPLPSFNSPTRLGMRIGYLIQEAPHTEDSSEVKYMVFEVTLLSCSAYWSLNAIMKILLNQYKKLIVLNDILGTCDGKQENLANGLRSLVPWHINAVVKTLDYLVHVYVEEQ